MQAVQTLQKVTACIHVVVVVWLINGPSMFTSSRPTLGVNAFSCLTQDAHALWEFWANADIRRSFASCISKLLRYDVPDDIKSTGSAVAVFTRRSPIQVLTAVDVAKLHWSGLTSSVNATPIYAQVDRPIYKTRVNKAVGQFNTLFSFAKPGNIAQQ